MLTLYVHHLLRQLPYEVHFNTAKFAASISAIIDDSPFTSEPWEHAPATVINKDHTAEPSTVSPSGDRINYPPSTQYPTRQPILDKFVNDLYIPWARVIPYMAIDGIIKRMPAVLQPTDPTDDLNILRPSKTGKYFCLACHNMLISFTAAAKTLTGDGTIQKKSMLSFCSDGNC